MAAKPDSDIKVYGVWVKAYVWDTKSRWRGENLGDDRRVIQYWDDDAELGLWFAEHLYGNGDRPVYDTYVFYGRDARWDDAPSHRISFARPAIGGFDRLADEIARQAKAP